MRRRCGALLVAASLLGCVFPAAAAKTARSLRCYQSDDPAQCFIAIAKEKLAHVAAPDDRADAVGELLYALAATQTGADATVKEARALAASSAVKPVKQMDLLYAIDMYDSVAAPPAEHAYRAALSRFATLEGQLKGAALIDLHVNACAIIGWDDPFRERWLDFAQSVCTPARLRALKTDGVASQALVLAMMPVAMTLADDRDGFAASADHALSWLRAAEKLAARSKDGGDQDFVAAVGVLMHTMNATCLDALEEPDAADGEVERALTTLRRMESRLGIAGKSSAARRQVVESLFDTAREADAKKLLRRLLAVVDADPAGKRIPLSEQIAIVLLAARIDHYEQADQAQADAADGQMRM
ncbi:MAG: hypothetical protein PHY45_12180 [Rhodocyclaceae bacterium]|nr:hypothetical protein [Rhodocyclaceae bacterium]